MTLILPRLTKQSLFTPELNEKEHRRQIDQDLQNLFIALRPSLVLDLIDETTIPIDAPLSIHFRVTLADNRTISNPTKPRDGQQILFEIIQDSIGSRTVTWGNKYIFGTDVPEPTLSTTAAKVDYVQFVYDTPADEWRAVGVARGY